MTATNREPSPSEEDLEPAEERKGLAYEGSRVPVGIVLVWVAFLVWALIYLWRWIPASWMEWFSR